MDYPPIRTAIIGYGASARFFHLPFIRQDERFRLVAFVERSGNKSREVFPETQVFSSVENMLGTTPDLVIICSPNDCHFEQAQLCLQAGCHVVVEKPFTVTVDQAETLINLANRQKKLLTVYHNRRLDGDFLTVKDLVDQGILGRLVEAELRFERWNPGLRTKLWKENGRAGSSLLEDLGSHLIDQAITLWGLPQWVTARQSVQRTGSQVEDAFELHLDYPRSAKNSGLHVLLKGGLLSRENLPRFSLFGTQGSFVKSGTDPQESQLMHGIAITDPDFGVEAEQYQGRLQHQLLADDPQSPWLRSAVTTRKGNYGAFYDNLAQAINQQSELLVKPREALAVMQIIAAAHLSSRERRSVALIPAFENQ